MRTQLYAYPLYSPCVVSSTIIQTELKEQSERIRDNMSAQVIYFSFPISALVDLILTIVNFGR